MEIVMSGIAKAFGTNQVLRDVSITLKEGEVHALMGENGAGKSTLMNILTGIHKADAGKITIRRCGADLPEPKRGRAKRCSFHPPRAQHLAKSNLVRKPIFNETEAQ